MSKNEDLSDKFEDAGADESVSESKYDYDTLRYRVIMKQPADADIVRASIEDNSSIKKFRDKGAWGAVRAAVQGRGYKISASHEESGERIVAQRAQRNDQWTVKSLRMEEGQLVTTDNPLHLSPKEASKISAPELLEQAVDELTNKIVGVKSVLDKALGHEFSASELVDVEVGDNRREGGAREIAFNGKKSSDAVIEKAQNAGFVVLHITKDPPSVFHDNVDAFMNPSRAIIQEQDDEQDAYVSIGSNTYGNIVATRNSNNNSWQASDEQNDYRRLLSADMNAGEVALELAQDKAFDVLEKKACESYLRDSPLLPEEISAIEVNGQVFVPNGQGDFVTEEALELMENDPDLEEPSHG